MLSIKKYWTDLLNSLYNNSTLVFTSMMRHILVFDEFVSEIFFIGKVAIKYFSEAHTRAREHARTRIH